VLPDSRRVQICVCCDAVICSFSQELYRDKFVWYAQDLGRENFKKGRDRFSFSDTNKRLPQKNLIEESTKNEVKLGKAVSVAGGWRRWHAIT
jgi:hypothetical protein